MYKRILVTTDGTKLSKKAVGSAISLAALCGAELVALKVVPRYPLSYFEGGIALSAEDIGRIEAHWAHEGQMVVDAIAKLGQKKGVKVKPLTVKGDVVSDAVLATVDKLDCDLVVMASHGRRGVKRLLLGSETQQVLTHAKIPVLILK
jgi:nucleotide-binding universal stress UspA family protein